MPIVGYVDFGNKIAPDYLRRLENLKEFRME